MTIAAPLQLYEGKVLPEWIDYNGHLNLAYYVLLFDYATDEFLDYIGLTEDFRAEQVCSTFAAEAHINYLRELKEGDKVRISTQLLDYDSKRFHYFHHMYHADEGYLAATTELLGLYMDMNSRRVAIMPESLQARLNDIKQAHSALTKPEQAGHIIKVKQ